MPSSVRPWTDAGATWWIEQDWDDWSPDLVRARIAAEPEFTKRLAGYMPNFELYLQFDSLQPGPQLALRGADLTDVRRRAIDRLNEQNLSTTLVVTLKKGLNDDQIGEILDRAFPGSESVPPIAQFDVVCDCH